MLMRGVRAGAHLAPLREDRAECLSSVVPNLQPRLLCFQASPPLFGPSAGQTYSAQKASPTCSYEVEAVNSRALLRFYN